MQIFRTRLLPLAANYATTAKLWLAFFWLPVRSKLKITGWGNVTLKLKFKNHLFDFIVSEYFDLIALEDTFISEDYKITLSSQKPVILDLGAHTGTEAIYYKLLYPKSTIFCFEPSPRNVSLLKKNASQFFNIIIAPIAISTKFGKKNFYLHPASNLSSSLTRRDKSYHSIVVNSAPLDSQIEKYQLKKIDLVKFDVEGEEYKIFSSFKNMARVKNFIGEFHAEITAKTVDDFLDLFPNFRSRYFNLNERRSIVILSQC